MTRRITLGFVVPADYDLPSEELAALKETLIEALRTYRSDYEGTEGYDAEKARRVEALLTED